MKAPADASGNHDDSELDTEADDNGAVQAASEDEGDNEQDGGDDNDDLAIQDEKKLGKLLSEEVRQNLVACD